MMRANICVCVCVCLYVSTHIFIPTCVARRLNPDRSVPSRPSSDSERTESFKHARGHHAMKRKIANSKYD